MAENNYDYRKLSAFRSFVKSTKVFVTDDHCLFDSGSAYSKKRSEEHTSELQSPSSILYAVFCLKKINSLSNM